MATAQPMEITGYITGSFDFFTRRYDVFDTGTNTWIVKLPKEVIHCYRTRFKLTGYRAGERQLVVHRVECVDSV